MTGSTLSPRVLLHIGLHKTGTTWLQQRVFRPGLHGFVPVEPRTAILEAFVHANSFTFDLDGARSFLRPFLEEAARRDHVAVLSHERLSGLPMLNGPDTKVVADRLHSALPTAHVLIVIREQRSMMLSTYKQYVKSYGTRSVEVVWRAYSPDERRKPNPGLEVFEYHRIIEHYQRLFGPDRVLVLPFELLVRDPDAFLRAITDFVGLSPVRAVSPERVNTALPGVLVGPVRWSNAVLRAFGFVDEFAGPIVPPALRTRRLRLINRLMRVVPPDLSRPFDRRLRAAVERVAAGRFGASNRLTERLTGLDLAPWGYEVGPAPADNRPDVPAVPAG